MAKYGNTGTRILLDQYDVSGFLNSANLNLDVELPPVTCFSDTGPRVLEGNYGHSHAHNGFIDTAGDSFDENIWALLSDTTEKLSNVEFETAGAGGADVFGTWVETAGDGTITNEGALVHGGTHACKLTAGATANTKVAQTISVKAGATYALSFWTRAVGVGAGRYGVYDVTGAADIVAIASTTVPGTSYTVAGLMFTTPAGCNQIRLDLWCPTVNADIAYFDDISITQVASDHFLTDLFGANAAGSVAYEQVVRFKSQPRSVASGQAILLNLTADGANGVSRGLVLYNATATGNANGTGYNQGITTTPAVYQVVIRVFSGTFTSFTLAVQESSDDEAGDPYATIAGLSQAITGTGCWRLTTTATTEAWKRVNIASWVGTNAVIIVTGGYLQGT